VPEEELLPYHPQEAGVISPLPSLPTSRMDALLKASVVATSALTTTRLLSSAASSSAGGSIPQGDATPGRTWVASAGLEASRRRRILESWLDEYAHIAPQYMNQATQDLVLR
jgi:hypothetical protein